MLNILLGGLKAGEDFEIMLFLLALVIATFSIQQLAKLIERKLHKKPK